MKILRHDGLGMSQYAKRLERGRFLWPSPADDCVAISASQLGYMLDGVDWRNPQRTWQPEAAARAPVSERSARSPSPGEPTATRGDQHMPFHAGLDWGGTSHAVCIIDAAGQVVVRIEAQHDAAGLADMLARLKHVASAAELPVAIERPSGLIVDALIAAGHPVIPVHPDVVKACRPRYRAASGKSNPGDAFMLADIMRTDGHRFRRLIPASNEIKALRAPPAASLRSASQSDRCAMVRGRDDLVAQRVALANQLRSLLESFWPGAAAIFAAIDSPIALAFAGRYPTPDSASRLRKAPGQLYGAARLLWPPLRCRVARPPACHTGRAGQRRRGRRQG